MLALDGRGSLRDQLYRALRAEILAGDRPPGARLPSGRALARELGVARNTAVLALEQLAAEGYAESRPRSGRFVRADLPEAATRVPEGAARRDRPGRAPERAPRAVLAPAAERLLALDREAPVAWTAPRPGLPFDFRYGRPALLDFPQEAWSRAVRRRLRCTSAAELDYGPPEGDPELRGEIARYLARARGVRCSAEQVLVVGGVQQALDLALRVLLPEGARVVVEEPHYRGARAALVAAGAELAPVPVDGEGLRTDELPSPRRGARLALLTPSHQFPTGGVLPLPRRLALLEWAARAGAFLFEDDYDSEYRYASRPVPAMQGLDEAGRVLYAGSFSKLLAPALRLGFLVVPEPLVRAFRLARAACDVASPTLLQRALADFLRTGGFERHLRRARVRSRRRRDALLAALEEHVDPRVEVAGGEAGLHVVLWLDRLGVRGLRGLRRRAAERGVGVYPVAPFYLGAPRPGLILGYGGLREDELRGGVRLLAGLLGRGGGVSA